MKMKLVVALAISLDVAFGAIAATFKATTLGDISSAAYWSGLGYSATPGDADTVALAVRVAPNYFTVSADMSISDVSFQTSGAYIDLGDQTIRLNAAAGTCGIEFQPRKSGFEVKGGTWFFANKAHLYCGRANGGTSLQDNHNITFDGTTITNIGTFFGSYYDPQTTVTFKNGAKVYADTFSPVVGTSTSNATLTVRGGSKIIVSGAMVYDQLPSAFNPETSNAGGNSLVVTGSGSRIELWASSTFGNAIPSNTLTVAAGGDIYSKTLNVGKNGSFGNAITVNDATMSSGDIVVGSGETSFGNILSVSGNSSVTLRNGTSLTVGGAGSGNTLDFMGGTIAFSGSGFLRIGSGTTSSNNMARISGGDAVIAAAPKTFDPFGAGHDNSFIIETGANVAFSCYAATNSSYNLMLVDNATFDTGAHGYLGFGSATSRGNKMVFANGAHATFKSFRICSYDNSLVVSNSTVVADDSERGICLGYSSASNCSMTVAGERASICTTGLLTLDKLAHIHFCVPERGWSEAPVSAKAMSLGKNSRITVDCALFAERHGGCVPLVKTETGLKNNVESVVALANAADNLPPHSRFFVSADGLCLMFRCPKRGFVISVQ